MKIIFVSFIGMLMFHQYCHSERMAPPQSSDLIGTWVGFTNQDEDFYRFDISERNNGFLSVSYIGESAQGYKVKSIFLNEFDVRFDLQPVDKGAEPILVSGKFYKRLFQLKVKGAGKWPWERELELMPMDKLLDRLKKVEDCYNQFNGTRK